MKVETKVDKIYYLRKRGIRESVHEALELQITKKAESEGVELDWDTKLYVVDDVKEKRLPCCKQLLITLEIEEKNENITEDL